MKNYISIAKEIFKDPRKKSITMLIIMVIFFSLTVITLRTNRGNVKNTAYTNIRNNYEFSLSKIKSNNYNFTCTINNDNNITTYEGKRHGDEELFSDGTNNYYSYDNTFYKDINSVWSKLDEFRYGEVLNSYYIEKIIDTSTFVKKEEFNDKKKVYNYEESTTKLIELFEKKVIDISDPVNSIILKTDSDNNVVEIEMDLSAYSVFKNYGNNVKINIKYSSFGDVKKIENIN